MIRLVDERLGLEMKPTNWPLTDAQLFDVADELSKHASFRNRTRSAVRLECTADIKQRLDLEAFKRGGVCYVRKRQDGETEAIVNDVPLVIVP